MDDKTLYVDSHSAFSMDNIVIKKLLQKLDNITLMETVDDVILRRIFIKFIQKIHDNEVEFESMKLLKKYMICQKILLNHELFENDYIYNKLLKSCPSFLWEQRIKSLVHTGEKDINFNYVIEKLKWETMIDLICNDDYRTYLMAIKQKSSTIQEVVKEIYEIYYF